MAVDFDAPPINDYLTKDSDGNNKDKMSDIWRDYQSTFYQTLVDYIGSYGFFLPNRTNDEIQSIQSPIIGQVVYNTTLDGPQVYTSAGWKTFSLF